MKCGQWIATENKFTERGGIRGELITACQPFCQYAGINIETKMNIKLSLEQQQLAGADR